jgi:hypothetical protein
MSRCTSKDIERRRYRGKLSTGHPKRASPLSWQHTAQLRSHLHSHLPLRIPTSIIRPIQPDPLGNRLLLLRNNIHRHVRIVQIIPAGALVRRIARPDHAEAIDALCLRAVYATIRPRCRANIGATRAAELVHGGADDGLRCTESGVCDERVGGSGEGKEGKAMRTSRERERERDADVQRKTKKTHLEVSVLVRRPRAAEVRILFVLILPIIARHAELLEEHGLAYVGGPAARVAHEARREGLRGVQVRTARVVHVVDAPVLHPAVRCRVVDCRE